MLEKSSLELGIIGNCSFSALINKNSRIVWSCLPRFNSNPMFCRLLTGDDPPDCNRGYFDIVLDNHVKSVQSYVKNTAILETKLHDKDGNIVKITDFAPRFYKNNRLYCPPQIVRMITQFKGSPRISIRCRPSSNYNEKICYKAFGSHHISYTSKDFKSRLTSNLNIEFILKEVFFILNKDIFIFFGIDEPFRDDITNTANDFYILTKNYWENFSKQLHLPLEWQSEVIRAAITLKMCQVQSSGAILAAMTTSIPESINSGRNWDYRYCWLRDSYHTIQALNRLGIRKTMTQYLEFFSNVVTGSGKLGDLQPLYGLIFEKNLIEKEIKSLKGYRGMGPVRVGNEAYKQIQNDNYGSVILSALLIFYDERLISPKNVRLYEALEHCGRLALDKWNTPDAGLWELRNSNYVHTFSSAMCWAACDRLSRIAIKQGNIDRSEFWRFEADRMKKDILERAWDDEKKSFVATLKDENNKSKRTLDASVLLLAHLQIIDPKDERFVQTVKCIEKNLLKNKFCYRYISEDDFGLPDNSFIICTFWFIEALHYIGETEKARDLFSNVLKYSNHVGLFSEDIDFVHKELWGNFPQTYSMVGIINIATMLSDKWETIGF